MKCTAAASCTASRTPSSRDFGLGTAIVFAVLSFVPACRCQPSVATDSGPKTLRPSRILSASAATFVAIDTETGLQELRIAADGKVEVFAEARREYSMLSAMLPSRPEICRVRTVPPADRADPTRHRSVQWFDPTKPSETPAQIEIGTDDPSAIMAMGDRCVVAFKGKVDVIDFKARPPARRTIHTYDQPASKPIDTFAWDGRVVVGVDDMVMPKFAFVYELGADGALSAKYTGQLGHLTNGTYGDAVLADGWLVAMTYERYRGGETQGLELFRVGPSELKPEAKVDESRADDDSKKTVLAGNDMTSWRALGVADDRILVCASKRGILSLPPGLRKEAKAQALDVGGSCDDMLVVDDRVYVLASPGARKPSVLLGYSFSGGKLDKLFERPLGVWANEIIHVSSRIRHIPEE